MFYFPVPCTLVPHIHINKRSSRPALPCPLFQCKLSFTGISQTDDNVLAVECLTSSPTFTGCCLRLPRKTVKRVTGRALFSVYSINRHAT